jgi:perosamine synthetase
LAPPHVPDELEHNWQSYQVSVRPGAGLTRNEIMDRLYDAGVPTRRGVMASHLEAPYRSCPADLPVTETVAASTLQLPMHPAITPAQVAFIVEALNGLAR